MGKFNLSSSAKSGGSNFDLEITLGKKYKIKRGDFIPVVIDGQERKMPVVMMATGEKVPVWKLSKVYVRQDEKKAILTPYETCPESVSEKLDTLIGEGDKDIPTAKRPEIMVTKVGDISYYDKNGQARTRPHYKVDVNFAASSSSEDENA